MFNALNKPSTSLHATRVPSMVKNSFRFFLTCICLRSRLFSYDLGHRTSTAHHRTFRDVTPGLWEGGRETMNFIYCCWCRRSLSTMHSVECCHGNTICIVVELRNIWHCC
jgi:hypothetical protein